MRHNKAFTILELLVVIAIISVLMSLLLPTLQVARRRGANTRCISNLHQIGISMQTYVGEYDQYLPQRLQAQGRPMLGNPFMEWLAPTAIAQGGGHATSPFESYLNEPKVLECPDRLPEDAVSYALNAQLLDQTVRLLRLEDPPRTPLVFDAVSPFGRYYGDLAYRHTGEANILFADWHVAPQYFDTLLAVTKTVPLPPAGLKSPSGGMSSGAELLLELRVAGTPWDTVDFVLREDGNVLGALTMLRETGSPNEQARTMGPFWLDPENRSYTMEMTLTTRTNRGGGNPIWLTAGAGARRKLCTLTKNKPDKSVDITQQLVDSLPDD